MSAPLQITWRWWICTILTQIYSSSLRIKSKSWRNMKGRIAISGRYWSKCTMRSTLGSRNMRRRSKAQLLPQGSRNTIVSNRNYSSRCRRGRNLNPNLTKDVSPRTNNNDLTTNYSPRSTHQSMTKPPLSTIKTNFWMTAKSERYSAMTTLISRTK